MILPPLTQRHSERQQDFLQQNSRKESIKYPGISRKGSVFNRMGDAIFKGTGYAKILLWAALPNRYTEPKTPDYVFFLKQGEDVNRKLYHTPTYCMCVFMFVKNV